MVRALARTETAGRLAFKNWFRSGKSESPEAATVEELLAAGEPEAAESLLRSRVKRNSRDLRARLKLAELLMQGGSRREAVDEYLAIADAYGHDGFFDKATALLHKVTRVAEGDGRIALKLEALRRLKALDRKRDLVTTSLLRRFAGGDRSSGSSAFEIQKLWNDLSAGPLVEQLSDDQLRRVFGAMRLVRFREGERVAEVGEGREEILLVAHGRIEARVRLRGGQQSVLRTFGPGDLIGDRSLLEHKPWPATYVAASGTIALRLTRDGLAEALTGEPDPKGLLDALRAQRHDREIVTAIAEMSHAS